MKAREKLAMEKPDRVDVTCLGGCVGCPDAYGYLPVPEGCCKNVRDSSHERCTACWDREIPENTEKEKNTMAATTKKTKAMLCEELEQANEKVRELKKELVNLEKYKQYEKCGQEMYGALEGFTNAGFTREEAFSLMMQIVVASLQR